MRFHRLIALAGFATSLVLGGAHVNAADITGAGATFPYPIYSKWAEAYKKETGNGLNYQSIGSGGGIKQIQAKTVTFGASDAPMLPADLDKWGLVQFPMVIGGVVPVIRVSGVNPGELTLDGATLADIYLGKIKSWDDAAIKKLNPTLKLPSAPILVVHRSDGSGTTFNFSNYLAQVSAEWKDKVGVNAAPEWPIGVGSKGNEGVAGSVTHTEGSIGYVEYAYAKQNKMTHIKLHNKDGKAVEPSVETFQAAADKADWAHAPGFYQILTNQAGDRAWPITAASFILMYKAPQDKAASTEALKFFDWAYEKGGKQAIDLDYIPLPASVVTLVKEKVWTQIKTKD